MVRLFNIIKLLLLWCIPLFLGVSIGNNNISWITVIIALLVWIFLNGLYLYKEGDIQK